MKNFFYFLVICLFASTVSEAQVTFKPGLRAGLNFSHFTKGDTYSYYDENNQYVEVSNDFKSKTDFYIGFYGALHLTKYYTLQPEINYSRQGSKYAVKEQNIVTNYPDLQVSYLSISMVNKFTFTDKFNMHIGPTIDFVVEDNFNTYNEVDLTFLLGFGYNINSNIGFEARIKKGIVPVLDSSNNSYFYYNDNNHTNVVFSLGATYTFDLK